MVKVCPSCGEKNFDDAKYCTHCTEELKHTKSEPTIIPPATTETNEFEGLQPKGYTPQSWQGRIYSKLALTFIAFYFLFFFIYSALIILIPLSLIVVIFGKTAISNGDTTMGKLTFVVGIILFILTLILLVLTIINL